MLVGVSALTTIGLRRYYAEAGDLPPPLQVCGGTTSRCDAFDHLLREAGIAQEQTVFAGAAVCALVAGALALALFRGAETRAATLAPVGGTGGGAVNDDDFADLLAANATYAEHFDESGFDGVAHAGVAIVTCMDSRIVPLAMLGLGHGDAKIFRNPGGRVTRGARGAGARRPSARRRADPGGPPHALRDGVGHRGRAPRAGLGVSRYGRLAGSRSTSSSTSSRLAEDVQRIRPTR